MIYTISDYNFITKNGSDYTLSDDILSVIQTLDKIVASSDVSKKKNDKVIKQKKIDTENWEQIRSFKATQMLKPEEDAANKYIYIFRNALNKISYKTLDIHKKTLIEVIQNITNSSENVEDELSSVVNILFEISGTNKIFSLLYAELLNDFISISPLFKSYLNDFIINYKKNIDNINYIDPENNYNDFCKNNKINDIRKAHTLFILNLFTLNIISLDEYLELTIYLQNKVYEFSETDRRNEIEELIENIFIFMSCKLENVITNDTWKNTIIFNIKNIIKEKKEQNKHNAVTSRALFRCMDIIDLIS